MMRGTSFLRGGNFKYIFEFIFSEELEVNGGQFYFVFFSALPGSIECIPHSKEIFQN